ncbi:MAG TPA: hypothetical protein VKB38_04930 [Terracidiphilus sp.]|nr:hypothetical protein [Terracidiphilus sp.]
MKRMSLTIVLSAITVSGILFLCRSSLNAQTPDSEQLTKFLIEVREHAVLAEADANLLESYTLASVTWQSHAHRINAMKEHANDLVSDFNKAKELQSVGSPWQQEAIDHLQPILKSMAEHLNTSIEYLNRNQSHVNMAPWHEYVRANREYMSRTVVLVRDYLDYGEAKAKSEELMKRLDVPPSTGQ